MKTTWRDMNVKEKLAIISACAAFICGWTLTGIAAFVPLLLSESAILFVLGQGMTYSAAVFGVSMYFNAEARLMKHDIDRHLAHTERMIKQRQDAAKEYLAAGRLELADNELDEVEVLKVLLPAEITEEQIKEAVGVVIVKNLADA